MARKQNFKLLYKLASNQNANYQNLQVTIEKFSNYQITVVGLVGPTDP